MDVYSSLSFPPAQRPREHCRVGCALGVRGRPRSRSHSAQACPPRSCRHTHSPGGAPTTFSQDPGTSAVSAWPL